MICPYCKAPLQYEEITSSEMYATCREDSMVGHCVSCEKSFRFKQKYLLIDEFDREEI